MARRPTEPAVGWGIKVGGPRPCLTEHFYRCQGKRVAMREVQKLKVGFNRPFDLPYRAVRVVLVPFAAAKAAGLLGEFTDA